MNYLRDKQNGRVSTIDRRTVLKTVGTIGVVGAFGTTTAAAQGESVCQCPQGTVAWGKFEFEDCDFVFEKGENFQHNGGLLVEITDWESKEGESCEPISVEYTVASGYEVIHICAFGGMDTDVDENPDGTYDSDLENNGGRRAAISHITFCIGERRFPGYQIDLIYGDVIQQFDPSSGVTYNAQNRLLQSYWSGEGLDTSDFGKSPSAYDQCWDDFAGTSHTVAIPTSITVDNGKAIACVEPDDSECLDDFKLVSYGAPGGSWDASTADQQVLWDSDNGTIENGKVCFEVDLPPITE